MKKIVSMSVIPLVAICCFFSAQLTAQDTNGGQAPDEFQRQIYVPFESLDILLDGNSNRVLLNRDEYEALLESARTREIKRAPFDSAVVSAQYTGEVLDGVALIKGELIVEPLNKGLVQIPLPFNGVAIRNAQLGDQPAKLWRDSNNQIVLLASSESRETLRIEMTVPLQTSAARQSMSIQLPSPAATRFRLTVPGNVEVKSGASVVSRDYDEASNATEFDLLGTRDPMNIVMSLNNRLLKDERVAVSRSVMIHRLTAHAQEMHVTCSMDVIHGALEEVEFTVPAGFDVSHVSTELLSQWEIKDSPEGVGEAGKRLVVKLRQPTREDFVLSITALRNSGVVGEWTAEDIRPVDVAGQVSVVGILADIDLRSAKLVSEGLIPIDHEFLMAAIPESVRTTNRGNPATIVAAFYAPQKDYSITSSFSVPEPQLIVKSNSRLLIDDQKLELQGGISLISRFDSRFGFKMTLPDSWRLNELTGVDGASIPFDRIGVEGSADFLVHLPSRIASNSSTKVFFRASLTPDGWLEKWETNQIDFPTVKIDGETKHSGAIAISTTEDLAIKPTAVTNLELLDELDKKQFTLDRNDAPLAYQFEDSKYQLNLELDRLKPSIIARTYNYVTINPTQMAVHAELIYDIKRASEGEFRFELPLDSPKSISISAQNESLKDFRSEDTETARRWIVQLAKPRKGQVHLLVDFQMPLEEANLAELKLAPVVVLDVDFQSSMYAIEGSTELDIDIATDGRAVDVGEFAEASYQPGRRLLGAYSWPNENMSLTVKCLRRPVYRLPSAIVQRAEMVTSISNNGKAQTAARFQLVTKQQPFLRVALPTEATLWSVQLDGQPAKPQVQNGSLLISLVGNQTGKLRDLQLVFESPARSFVLVGQVQAHAPTLWLNETSEGSGIPVPLVDLHWRLIMPDGFSVSHSDGKFESNQLENRISPIEQLGRWVYLLGGGIGEPIYTGHIKATSAAMSTDSSDWSPKKEKRIPLSIGGQMRERVQEDPSVAVEDSEEFGLLSSRQPGEEKPGDAGSAISGRFKAPATNSSAADAPSGGKFVTGPEDSQDKDTTQILLGRKASLWALSGLRSLSIELTETGNAIEFYNLGEQPILTATVVNQSRLNWIAVAMALLIAALGVLLTNRRIRSKVLFVVLILLIACLAPLAGASVDALRTIVDLAILAAVFASIYFVLAGVLGLMGRSISLLATRISLLFLVAGITIAAGNQACGQEYVDDVAGLKRLLTELQTPPQVSLPNDAIIIPFDANDPAGREKADRLLVPYEHYLKLLNKSDAGEQPKTIDGPVDYVLSSAQYSLELTLDEDVTIEGKLVVDLLTDKPVSVALPLLGGALIDAKVDGKPAKLQFLSGAEPNADSQQQVQVADSNIVQLHLEGRGARVFAFKIRIKPARQGGWRMILARLPVGMTRGLNLISLAEPTEVRLNSDSDRRSIETTPNQRIATVLSADGTLRLQWKPSTATQAVDQSLTANSEAIFDVREDGLRLNWRVDLDFRGSERDVFSFALPDGFLVEQVNGENVRAWDVQQNEAGKRLNITTLSTAKDRETFTIELSRRDFVVGDVASQFDAPYLTVEGAALHKGIYTVRRSPIVELKTTKQQAASRIDQNPARGQIDMAGIDAKSSPLGIESFQVIQFVTTPFKIGLQASLVPRTIKAETLSVLRIGQSEADLEMKINVSVARRPIYKLSFDLPQDAEIRSLVAGQNETWTTEQTAGIRRVQLYFPAGIKSDFSIVVDAKLTAYSGATEWSIPKVKLNEADEQSGFVAIQVDPALAVTSSDLDNCENVLLQQVESWLNRSQRATTRLVLSTKGGDYDATLRFTKIEPRVTVETVTNVRTTLFAIEETILLDFNIQQAGIRQLQFELPAGMRNARINAKLVSETLVEDSPDNPNRVKVTLNLQDEVIDTFRVVVENDRQLSGDRQNVPVPRVLTGVTEQRYATLQNAGRDEISVIPGTDFQSLNRQLSQFSKLKQKLSGGEVTMAYVAQADNESPALQYETKRREVFDTVAASIEFSKTIMVVDSSGAYRALQNFQVNNRSEQYLEIELPEGAQLLTVLVEGKPVKPVAWPAAQNPARLRIPLVKTQLGDLDYPVQLKYSGRLGELTNFSEVEFPVIETLNINVQLSQLHLRLPDSHRWMNFGGTMTKVDDRGELEESYLSYKSRQIQQLAEQIQAKSSSSGSYSKSRAYSNLKRLQQDMDAFETANPGVKSDKPNDDLAILFQGNSFAIQQAQESYDAQKPDSGGVAVDNRANFNGLVEGQSARIGRNSINKVEQNFSADFERLGAVLQDTKEENSGSQDGKSGKDEFDSEWFARNQLNGRPDESAGNAPAQKSGNAANESAQKYFEPVVSGEASQTVDDSISFYNPLDTNRSKDTDRPKDANRSNDADRLNDVDRFEDAKSGALRGLSGDQEPMGRGRGFGSRNQSIQPSRPNADSGLPNEVSEQEISKIEGLIGNELLAQTNRVSGQIAVESALASLDIELPDRGSDYYFKSPRGNASVVGRPLESSSFSRWMSALIALGVCVGASLVCWFVCWMCKNPVLKVIAVLGMLAAGIISMASAILPVYGFLAFAASVVLLIDMAMRLVWKTEAVEPSL